jgi:hypothetical protein
MSIKLWYKLKRLFITDDKYITTRLNLKLLKPEVFEKVREAIVIQYDIVITLPNINSYIENIERALKVLPIKSSIDINAINAPIKNIPISEFFIDSEGSYINIGSSLTRFITLIDQFIVLYNKLEDSMDDDIKYNLRAYSSLFNNTISLTARLLDIQEALL